MEEFADTRCECWGEGAAKVSAKESGAVSAAVSVNDGQCGLQRCFLRCVGVRRCGSEERLGGCGRGWIKVCVWFCGFWMGACRGGLDFELI